MSAGDRLDRPGLKPLWAELARRFGDGPAPVSVSLRDLSLAERQAVADLLGVDRLPGATARLRLDRIAIACGAIDGAGLRALVEDRLGPIVDRRAARLATRHAREALWAWLAEDAAGLPLFGGDRAVVATWVEGVRGAGVPGADLDAHRRRLARVLVVLGTLQADGVGLASLSADLLGDAHALDRGRSAAALVLDAVALARDRTRASDAEGVRLLWEEVGVAPDPLSSTVLTLGIRPPAAGGPLADWLRGAADEGEPTVLTLAQLRRWPLAALPPAGIAFVVENPALLSEAVARSWSGPPLICSSGRPSIAVVTLLRQLGAEGARLAQHADFDAGGLGITGWLAERAGTVPWRMEGPDYLAAVAVPRDRVPLPARLPASPWAPGLHDVMTSIGVAVHEEELRTDLLAGMGA